MLQPLKLANDGESYTVDVTTRVRSPSPAPAVIKRLAETKAKTKVISVYLQKYQSSSIILLWKDEPMCMHFVLPQGTNVIVLMNYNDNINNDENNNNDDNNNGIDNCFMFWVTSAVKNYFKWISSLLDTNIIIIWSDFHDVSNRTSISIFGFNG